MKMKLYEVKQNDFVYIDGKSLLITDCNPYLGYIEAESCDPWKRYRFEGEDLMKAVTLIDDEPDVDVELPKKWFSNYYYMFSRQFWNK